MSILKNLFLSLFLSLVGSVILTLFTSWLNISAGIPIAPAIFVVL
ncbi:MAG: hypothetical protein AB4426_12000 [Xenococcaceae cyanobacterium]